MTKTEEMGVLSTSDRLRRAALFRAAREFQIQLLMEIFRIHPEDAIAPDRTNGLIDAFHAVTAVLERFHHVAPTQSSPGGLQ